MRARLLLKKLLRRAFIAVPAPGALTRLARFYVETKIGEGFGNMRINGEVRWLRAHAPACRTLFDVGAYTGAWTQHALQANPRAVIHCFEPLRANFERLVAHGFPPQVTCNALALSDVTGTAEMFARSLSLHDRRGPGFDGADDTAETVQLTTLEEYCAGRDITDIDLLKIDAEGHDLAVLRGGAGMIREGRIRRIQFEYGPRNVFSRVFLRDFFVFFAGLPYRLYQVMPRRLAPVPMYHTELENLRYKNFVALHESVRA